MFDCLPLLAQSELPLTAVDLVVLVAALIGVTTYGLYMGRREEGASDFFLAGKTIAWWAIAGSILGTNISSHHLVGMMGAGLKEGFAQANFEFGAIAGLLVLCYFFLPLYRRMGVYTLSEYLGRRFDDRSRLLYSITNIVFLVIQMCGTLVLGGVTVEKLTEGTAIAMSYSTAVWGLAVVAAVYTIVGGLKAVIYTDVIQSALLFIGAAVIAVLAIYHPNVGGISGLLEKEPTKFHVIFEASHDQLPWTGVFTGLMVMHLYYWGTNQFIVQRALGAKSGWDGRMGIILAGFCKLLIPFICIVPGMAAGYILTIDPATESDTAFAGLARTLLPSGYGIMGLVLAALMGAIISTIDSMMNSAATLYTFDIHQKYIRPQESDARLILVGRAAMLAIAAGAIALALSFGDVKGGIFNTMVDYNAYLVPGVLIAFLAGIFQRSATATASVAAIAAGPVAGILFEQIARHGFDHRLQHFHRTGLAALACWLVILAVSWITSHERSEEREQYVWWRYRYHPADEAAGRPWWQADAYWAALLVACTVALAWYFW